MSDLVEMVVSHYEGKWPFENSDYHIGVMPSGNLYGIHRLDVCYEEEVFITYEQFMSEVGGSETGKWASIVSAPTGIDNKIQLWHKVHKCSVSGHINKDLNQVIEMTKTTMWPIEAFTHWMPLPEPPLHN